MPFAGNVPQISLDLPTKTLIELMFAMPPGELLSILTGHEKNDQEKQKQNPTTSAVDPVLGTGKC